MSRRPATTPPQSSSFAVWTPRAHLPMLRLIDELFAMLGRRGPRARGRLAYRMLFDLVVPEHARARR
jgi:hypothetical protein